MTYFRVVFTPLGWTKRDVKVKKQKRGEKLFHRYFIAFIFDRGEEREQVEGVIDGVLNR